MSTPSRATTSSGVRSRQTPTRDSGPTPRRRSSWASRSARRVQLRVRERLAAPGRRPPRPACAPPARRTARGRSAPAGYPRSVAFHSSSTCARSAALEQRHAPRADRSGSAATASSSATKCPSIRSTVAASNSVARGTRAAPRSARPSSSRSQRRGRTWPCSLAALERLGAPPRPAGAPRRARLEREQHLEERGAAERRAPAPAPPPAARTAAPGGRRRRAPPRARGRAAPGSVGSPDRSAAQHQRVDEEADQPLHLARACGRRWACPPPRRPAPRSAPAAPARRRAAS